MCRFAAPLAFNFMAAVAIPPSSRHSEGDRDVQDTVSFPLMLAVSCVQMNAEQNFMGCCSYFCIYVYVYVCIHVISSCVTKHAVPCSHDVAHERLSHMSHYSLLRN